MVASIPNEPKSRRGFLPTLSITMMAGIVVRTLMMPVIPVARRELVLLVSPNDLKMIGA